MYAKTTTTLAALADTLLDELDPAADAATRAACERFVAAFFRAAQPLHRGALGIAAAWLDLESALATGVTFAAAPPAARRATVARWRRSRLAPRRLLVRLLLVLTVLAYFDSESTTARLGIPREEYLGAIAFYTGGPTR